MQNQFGMAEKQIDVDAPDFKTLLDKLLAAGWIELTAYTPPFQSAGACMEIFWTERGYACLSAIKAAAVLSPCWPQIARLQSTLSSVEDAHLKDILNLLVPDRQPSPPN